MLESERMAGGICAALAVSPRPEEEEAIDPGEVTDGNVPWGGILGDSARGLDGVDWDRPQSGWRINLLLIERQMASRITVKFSHVFVTGVVAPHGCEDLTNGAEVLLNRSLLDRFPLHGRKAGMNTLGKNLEEMDQGFDTFEIRGDVQPDTEAPPLAPGDCVFLEFCRREALGDCLLCSIVVS